MIDGGSNRRRYEICIRGPLSRRYESAFDGVMLEPRNGQTMLRADLADQSQLYGLLNRLRDFGIELISVNSVEGKPMPAEQALTGDEPVVEALRARHESAVSKLYKQHLPAMRRMARTYVRSDAVADEVVQETWLAVLSGIDRFQARAALSTWIYSILINQAKTHSVRENRMLPFSALGVGDSEEPAVDPERFQSDADPFPGHWAAPPRPWQKPERRLLSLEVREHLKGALDDLPERQRMIVALRDVDGLSAEEVCGRLSLSPENQRVLLHRGRSRLRSQLEQYFDEVEP